MMSSHTDLKERGERLHQRLLAGSLTASSEIAELFLRLLIKSLAREFKQPGDPHIIDSAVEDALLNYFEHPEKFDPGRSSLFIYLRIRAKTYLLNRLGQQTSSKKVVELEAAETVHQLEEQNEPDAEVSLVSQAVQTDIMQQVNKYIDDPMDLRIVALMVEGARDTAQYAEVLGISDHPLAEQRKMVKRHKDRIKKIIERKIRRGRRKRQ